MIESLEARQLFSIVVAPIPVPQVTVGAGITLTKTLNEGTNLLPSVIAPVPTLTAAAKKSADPTAPTPAIVLMGTTTAGPGTVFVHALDSVLGAGTPLTARYVWDFGDPTTQYNQLTGWNAAHTYDKAGTYTLKLTLTNQLGKVATLSVNVVVSLPTRRTIYVDSIHGSDKNSGLSTESPIKTWDKVVKLIGPNTDLLFHAGETFPVDQSMSLPYQNVLVGSYGSGTNPVLLRGAGVGTSILSLFNNSSNIIIQNLTLDSIWKPVGVIANKVPADGIFPGGTDITIRGVQFLNLDVAIDDDRNPQGVLVQNCVAPLATGLRGVFLWGQGTDQVILGNYVANSTREHDVRTVAVERELIAYNNLTNLDRSKLGDVLDYNKGTVDVHRGQYAYVANNWLYGGELRVGPRNGPAAVPGDTSQWCVFEGNHTFGHEVQIYPGTYHVMIRNNVFNMSFGEDISVIPRNPAGDNIADITIVNNTGFITSIGGNFINITGGGAAGQITLANNLWIAPLALPGENATAAILIGDTSDKVLKISTDNVWQLPASFNPYAAGGVNYIYPTWAPPHGYLTPAAWNALPNVSHDLFAATRITSTLMPVVGSVASTAARPVPGIFVDIYGNPRPADGVWSAGAVQTT